MKAFVINLPKAVDRRNAMKAVMEASPFRDNWEFVEGVNGRAMNADALRAAFDYDSFGRRIIGAPSQGEVGCSLSHYSLWRRVAAMESPALILEDDVHFDGDWTDILEFARHRLDSPQPRALLCPRHFFYRNPQRFGSHMVMRPYIAYGAECYFINPAGARLLVGLGRPAYIADDWDYFSRCGLGVQAIVPHPVVMNYEFVSDIGMRSPDRLPWDSAAAVAMPKTFTFGYLRVFYTIVLHKLGILHKYLSPGEQ